jgi:hypothetical protein
MLAVRGNGIDRIQKLRSQGAIECEGIRGFRQQPRLLAVRGDARGRLEAKE